MKLNNVEIEDTYAEAFGMRAARLLITAADVEWARTAASVMTGFGTSVIGCNCETGIEGPLPESTPDGRPGVRVLLFATSSKQLEQQLVLRVGQCVMTCPTTACFDDLPSEERLKVGSKLRFFGDGHQISKRIESSLSENGATPRRLWRIPVMDGEFVVEDKVGTRKAVAGGNFFIMGRTEEDTSRAARAAVRAMREIPGIIMPFPGGVVRSGSKIGSKYRKLIASTNSPYCPTLRGQVESALPPGASCCLEIVVDGLDEESIGRAMAVGIRAACTRGVVRISAGNYGGKLGKFHFHLLQLLEKN
ncbi:MAG: formylmethanofuran--tetrahydromethanopterin N-formyltransferase [Acidobacteriota bacterium]|nr:formylmethanofuran--tetrahydromethanopterin N-formyltransferase [Acidobacteriota bacterium]